jgi:hypothetical protein
VKAQKHLLLGRAQRRGGTLYALTLTGTMEERLLGKRRKARCAVPLPMPNFSEIDAQDCPSARRTATLSTSTATRGLPPSCFPRARAAATPVRVRRAGRAIPWQSVRAGGLVLA